MNVGAGQSHPKDRLIPELQPFEDGKRLLGGGTIGEPETILMGHDRLDRLGHHIEHLEKTRDIAQPVEMLSAASLSLQEGLLAQR